MQNLSPQFLTSTNAFNARSPHEEILYRGGEALQVEQLPDRFTIMQSGRTSSDLLAELEAQLKPEVEFAAEILQEIPAVGVELRVKFNDLEQILSTLQLSENRYIYPVYQLQNGCGEPIYLTNQITLLFAESTTVDEMKTIAQQAGLAVFKLVPGVPKAFVFRILSGVNPLQFANQLMQHPKVLIAEPNIVVLLRSVHPVHSPSSLNSVKAQGEAAFLRSAWNQTQGNESIVIAVAETTIDFNHPFFQQTRNFVAPFIQATSQATIQATSIGSDPRFAFAQEPVEPDQTQNLAAMISTSGVGRVAQVAPQCSFMPMAIGKFLDDAIVEQMCDWVVEKEAAILLCEWQASLSNYPLSLRQQAALSRAATQGRKGKGCWIGFSVSSGENFSTHSSQKLNGFALHPDVMAIAPVPLPSPQPDTAPPFSSNAALYGGRISLCAPQILQIANRHGNPSERSITEFLTAGTIVAGVAALVLSINPDLTAAQVRSILQNTADKKAGSVPLPETTQDLHSQPEFNFYATNGYSRTFGYGTLNPLQALLTAQEQIHRFESPARWIEQHSTSPVDIPDGDRQGLLSCLPIEEDYPVLQVEVSVEIEHSFMSDLEIYLIAPKANPILLQPRTAGRINVLRKTYTPDTTPLLQTLRNQSTQGNWQLHVIDRVPAHTGVLKGWGLRLGVGC